MDRLTALLFALALGISIVGGYGKDRTIQTLRAESEKASSDLGRCQAEIKEAKEASAAAQDEAKSQLQRAEQRVEGLMLDLEAKIQEDVSSPAGAHDLNQWMRTIL